MVCSWHLQVGLVVVGGHCRWKMHNSILSTWFFERSGCFNWIELQQVGIHSICNASLHCSLIGPSFVQTKGPYRIFHFRLGSMGMNPVHLHAPFSGLTCWMILWWVFPKWREISWWEMKHLIHFYINGVPEKASWLVVDSGFWSHLNRFLNSQGWFPTSFKIQDHPKKGSFLGGVFAHFFCFESLNMVENIGLQETTDSQGADVPIAVVSSNFETNSSRHLGLGMGDTDVETSKPW